MEADNVYEFLKYYFITDEIIAEVKNDNQIGIIFKLKNSKFALIFSDIKELNESDKIQIIESVVYFDILSDCMNYLRSVRFDHEINYEIKQLTEPLLGELYKNRKVEIKDILGV